MKMKRIMSIIAFVATMFVTLASCGQNGQQYNRPTCGGPGIGIDTVTAEANSLPWPVTDIELDSFYLSLPEGWNLVDKFDNAVNVLNGTIEDDIINGPYVTIQVVDADGNTPETVVSEMVTGANAIARDDVNILEYTYKVCTYVEDAYNHILLVRKQSNKLIKFDIINSNTANPDIRSIIHQLELK